MREKRKYDAPGVLHFFPRQGQFWLRNNYRVVVSSPKSNKVGAVFTWWTESDHSEVRVYPEEWL